MSASENIPKNFPFTMKLLDECFLNTRKIIPFYLKVLHKSLLNTPKTILIDYEGTW